MSKKILLGLTVLIFFTLLITSPVRAASNPLAKFSQSFKNKLDQLYLKLPGDKPGIAVLNQSNAVMQDVKSARARMEFSGQLLSDANEEVGRGKLMVTGPAELAEPGDPTNVKQEMSIDFEVSMGGTTLKANADLRQLGKEIFVKLNTVPVLPFFDVNQVRGQWLKLPDPESAGSTTQSLSTEQQQRMEQAVVDLMNKSQIGKAKKAKENGKDVFVVDVQIPDEAILTYMDTITDIAMEGKGEKYQTDPQDLRNLLAAMDDFKTVLWIDQKSFYLLHAESNLNFDLEKVPGYQSSTASPNPSNPLGMLGQPTKLSGKIILDFSDFNQPVAVEKPEGARDLQEVFSQSTGLLGIPSAASSEDIDAVKKTMVTPKPVELQELTAKEKELLKQYGMEIEDVIE